MYVGTSELHFCSPHWIQKYLNPKKNCQPVQNPLILYYPHAYPSPILSHPMHALPLFCPTLCMSSPYSVPSHAYPPPILSHSMHALPLFYPTHACPPPILSHIMHTLPPILSQPMHTLPSTLSQPRHTLFYSTPYMLSLYSIPLYACPLLFSTSPHMPLQYSIPAHACFLTL